jgi:siroheme synthase
MPKGKVYLVGSGPGDVELITLKGYELIRRADVILYDHLMPLELLQLQAHYAAGTDKRTSG